MICRIVLIAAYQRQRYKSFVISLRSQYFFPSLPTPSLSHKSCIEPSAWKLSSLKKEWAGIVSLHKSKTIKTPFFHTEKFIVFGSSCHFDSCPHELWKSSYLPQHSISTARHFITPMNWISEVIIYRNIIQLCS